MQHAQNTYNASTGVYMLQTFHIGLCAQRLIHDASLETGPLQVHPRHVHTLDHRPLGDNTYSPGCTTKLQHVKFKLNMQNNSYSNSNWGLLI